MIVFSIRFLNKTFCLLKYLLVFFSENMQKIISVENTKEKNRVELHISANVILLIPKYFFL